MENLLYFIFGVLILLIFTFLFKLSSKIIIKLLLNAISGGIIIFFINMFGKPFGIYLDLNLISAIIVGIFGIFGVIILFLVR